MRVSAGGAAVAAAAAAADDDDDDEEEEDGVAADDGNEEDDAAKEEREGTTYYPLHVRQHHMTLCTQRANSHRTLCFAHMVRFEKHESGCHAFLLLEGVRERWSLGGRQCVLRENIQHMLWGT
jgi:hypothetical protein